MRKKGITIQKTVACCFALLLLSISACGTDDNSNSSGEDAKELGKEFVTELYTVDNADTNVSDMEIEETNEMQHEFSSYLTEDEFKNLANRRFFLMPLEAAYQNKTTISVQDVKLDEYESDMSENDELDFEHSFTLVLDDLKEDKEIKITGEMTVIETEDGPKINRYYDTEIPGELINQDVSLN